jgi:hypothetical protein
MGIESERKAAGKARGVLALLSPTAAYAHHIVHLLRLAGKRCQQYCVARCFGPGKVFSTAANGVEADITKMASYSQAYAGLSIAYNLDYQKRWSDNPDISLRLAKHDAERAIEKNLNEPLARLVASWAAIFQRDCNIGAPKTDAACPAYRGGQPTVR